MKILGETAKRELTFSWIRKLLTDVVCFFIGHTLLAGSSSDFYCDRCWRWGK